MCVCLRVCVCVCACACVCILLPSNQIKLSITGEYYQEKKAGDSIEIVQEHKDLPTRNTNV